jgi:hypothetical protein
MGTEQKINVKFLRHYFLKINWERGWDWMRYLVVAGATFLLVSMLVIR